MADNLPLIQQINFTEGGVEIVYIEPRDVEAFNKTGVSETRITSCPAQHVEPELAELIEDIQILLEAIQVRKRNPTFGK